jgi:hypothetical protein
MNPEPPTTSGVSKSKSHLPWITLIVVLCVPVFFVGSFLAAPFVAIYKADEGFKKAKQTIDPEQLRIWALQEMQKHGDTNTPSNIPIGEIPTSEIPQPIQKLYSYPPENVFVNGDVVAIIWGGGFFGWGIQIGNTNYSEPYKSTNPDWPYNFEWVPGIYYTRETAWPLL